MDHHRMVTSILGMTQGVGAIQSVRGFRGKEFGSKVALEFTAKYGAEGKLLVQKCLEHWFRPMEFVVKSNPTCFEDSVSNRIVNIGARYVWHCHSTVWK
jgi:hypothetical protein